MDVKITLRAEIEILKDIVGTHMKSLSFITMEIMGFFFLTKHVLIQGRVIILSLCSKEPANETPLLCVRKTYVIFSGVHLMVNNSRWFSFQRRI